MGLFLALKILPLWEMKILRSHSESARRGLSNKNALERIEQNNIK